MELAEFVKTHQPCPCGKSSDAYAVRKDGSGRCFGKCGGRNFWPKPFWEHLAECSPRPYQSRNVPAWVGERLGFTDYVDADGTVQFFGWETPGHRKKFRRANDKTEQQYAKLEEGQTKRPIGGVGLYDISASKSAVVVEGEPDAAAAYFMLNDKMANETPVYWIPGASVSPKDRQAIYDELSKYERVILAIENDEPGNKLKATLGELLPQSIRIAHLNLHKDASDYNVAGAVKEFKRAVANYSRYTPEYIFNGADRLSEIWSDTAMDFYVPTSITGLNELVPGIPTGHVTLITGSEGIGKSEILRSIAWDIINYNNQPDVEPMPISLSMFEEDNKTTLKSFACYDQGINFRDHTKNFTLDDFKPTLEKLKDNFYITDIYKARDEMSVASFMAKVEYLHFVLGVRYFVFDPINHLRPDTQDETLEKFLSQLIMDLGRFCVDNKCGVITTAHITDDGKVRDSRMIAKAASIRIDVSRDMENFDENERNKTYLKVTKNRPFSRLGDAGFVTFDTERFTISEGYIHTDESKVLPTYYTHRLPSGSSGEVLNGPPSMGEEPISNNSKRIHEHTATRAKRAYNF